MSSERNVYGSTLAHLISLMLERKKNGTDEMIGCLTWRMLGKEREGERDRDSTLNRSNKRISLFKVTAVWLREREREIKDVNAEKSTDETRQKLSD